MPANRLTRMARLGAMSAGVAGNMAMGGIGKLGRGERPRLRDLLLTPRNISRITDELAKMRGAAMKMGQLMSMDTGDVLPPELSQIMARLRDDAHIMPPKQLRDVLNAQWGDGWLRSFKRFDVRPVAAASIGQVHRAQTRDGRDLAIKVQYPGVARSIDSDVSNVGALIKMTGLLPKGFALGPYLEEAKAQLRDETDYAAEADALTGFGRLLAGDDRFIVPGLAADWSTGQVLAMDYIESQPIEVLETASQPERDRAAADMITLMLRELFEFGVMQTDPNFANYRYHADTKQIVLLDFGATRRLSDAVQRNYRDLMKAGMAADPSGMILAARAIGFIAPDENPDYVAQICDMMQTVFAQITKTQMMDFADQELSRQMQAKGMALAESGFVPPPVPMDALMVQRKFGGMYLLAARLRARVDVGALLQPWL